MDVAGVVLAAGGGRRLTPGLPAGLRLLGGVPLVCHAAFALCESGVVGQLVVVGPPGAEDEVRRALTVVLPGQEVVVVDGAGSPHGALHRSLCALAPAAGIVVVHDALRPLAPAELVIRVVDAVRAGADLAVPVLEVTETVKELDAAGWITRTVPRETLVRVQMPQAVRRGVLDAAHGGCPSGDLVAGESGGGGRLAGEGARVLLVQGDEDAFPVAGEPDLGLAEAVLAARRAVPHGTR